MPNKPTKRVLIAAAMLSLSTMVFSASVVAADSVKINELVVAKTPSNEQQETTLKAVRAFYGFWNTGDLALLK
jgi:hypothetical protein